MRRERRRMPKKRGDDIRRGDIFYINNSRGQVGSEMMKDRPGIIVSNNTNNRHSNEVTVVFLTTSPKKETPTHVTIRSTERKSVALCEAPTTIDKLRISNYIGRATGQEMEEINEKLKIALRLD